MREIQRKKAKIHVEDVFLREGLITEAERDKARELFNTQFKYRYACAEEDMFRFGLDFWRHMWDRNMEILGIKTVIANK